MEQTTPLWNKSEQIGNNRKKQPPQTIAIRKTFRNHGDGIYHITFRGNNKQNIFVDDKDRLLSKRKTIMKS